MQPAVVHLPQMDLLSDVPGRQRWRVPAIDSRPRLAAAVEIALRKQSGALLVKANPLTGRILIKWQPGQRPPEIKSIICKALETGPLSEEAYRKLRGAPDRKAPQADPQIGSRRHQALSDSFQPPGVGRCGCAARLLFPSW